jgi:polar amino acid transport system substrate-binding protein
MMQNVVSELAPTGVLRAGINLSNFLLVTCRSQSGDPEGVAPDMAHEIAARLGVPVKYAPFNTPGELADAAESGIWDIGLIGAEPQRAEKITFTAAGLPPALEGRTCM